MARIVSANTQVPITAQLANEATNVFPRAIVVNPSGTVIGQIDLTPVAGASGKYRGAFTFTTLGDHALKFVVYTDAGRTQISTSYGLTDEIIQVKTLESEITQIGGDVRQLVDKGLVRPVADFG